MSSAYRGRGRISPRGMAWFRSGGNARFLKTGRLWSTWPPSGGQKTAPRQQVSAVAAATGRREAGGREEPGLGLRCGA
jgi:hypothetical protein